MTSNGVTFWDTVVTNLAPIIIALTGFGAMAGAFFIQYRNISRQFDDQNRKIDQNALRAADDRAVINAKVDDIHSATNGMKDELVKASRAEGVIEGRALEKQSNIDNV